MKFAELIPGLLKGKDYTFTDKGKDDVHYYITITSPVNHENECLCIVYFDEVDEDGEIDPVPYEIERLGFTTNRWREAKSEDFFTEEDTND